MSGVPQAVFVVLPAAGTGQRFTSTVPKQYCSINGQPLIVYTLTVLQRIAWIQRVYLAISDGWIEYVQDLLDKHRLDKVELVKGGTTRHASIKNCVSAITAATELSQNGESTNSPVVIVHDAVRPFVDEETYRKVAEAAAKYQASGAMCGLVSTVLSVTEDGFMDQALNRSLHCASHTPQAFTLEVIKAAFENISATDLASGTECLDLAWKHCGVKAKLVPAPDEVEKVTYRKDIYAAEALAREQSISTLVICQEASNLAAQICKNLLAKRLKVQQGESIADISDKSDTNAVVLILKQKTDLFRSSVFCPVIGEALGLLNGREIQPTLTVVFQCQNDVPELEYRHLREFCRNVRREQSPLKAMVHLVLWVESQEVDQTDGLRNVSELVASLVFDRKPQMSGQIFTLP